VTRYVAGDVVQILDPNDRWCEHTITRVTWDSLHGWVAWVEDGIGYLLNEGSYDPAYWRLVRAALPVVEAV
jgi:hypothetical protein